MKQNHAMLYYHSVGNLPLSVSIQTFRKQIGWLRKKHFKCDTLIKTVDDKETSGNANLTNKRVIVTFDDCFESVYENAVPIIKQFSFKATFFATVNYVGKIRWGSERYQRWSDKKTEEFNVPFAYMSWDQLKSLVDFGMEIGAHTITHRNLTELSSQEQEEEIAGSKERLEKELGIEVDTFCYPRGKYNDHIVNIIKKVGFKAACTTKPGYVLNGYEPYKLNRFPAGNFNLEFKSLFAAQYRLLCDFKKSAKRTIKHVLK